MFIRDSRRSYRTYAYTEVLIHVLVLISISNLSYEFTELILILRSLHLFGGTCRYHREITESILVLPNLFLYGSTRKYYLFKCPKRCTLVLKSNLSYFTVTKILVGTTEIHYTKVPVGTIGLILILLIREYP